MIRKIHSEGYNKENTKGRIRIRKIYRKGTDVNRGVASDPLENQNPNEEII